MLRDNLGHVAEDLGAEWGLWVAEMSLYESLDLVSWHVREIVKDMEVGGETRDVVGLEEI
jgi:hypothetical protein